MREIKLRAWDGKKMYYPMSFKMGVNPYTSKPAISIPLPLGGYVTTSHIMESVGIIDCEKKEVYEKDIVEVSKYETDERFLVVITDIRELPKELFGSSVNWVKVLGNILEHPNLIEE